MAQFQTALNTVLAFIRNRQIDILTIYYSEIVKGRGAMFITYNDSTTDIDVAYYPLNKIETPLQEAVETKIKQIEEAGHEPLNVKDKLIITMPQILKDNIIHPHVLYLVIRYRETSIIFQGIAQETAKYYQYVLIADKLSDSNDEVKYNWTISNTPNYSGYIELCKEIIERSSFNGVRADARYTNVIIGGVDWIGMAYLRRVQKKHPKLLKYLDKFRENDLVGEPIKHFYNEFGLFSTETLRYVNSICNLIEYFNIKDGVRICEFGGGFGGFANVLGKYCKYGKYYLYEIPEVIDVAEKYCAEVGANNIEFMTVNNESINIEIFDLFISNYALCELDESGIDIYINSLMKKARNCYLEMNIWDSSKKKSFIARLREIFTIVDEFPMYPPKTGYDNYILVCYDNILL